MSSISSLSSAISALKSSQTALNTTAHNLSNLDTQGYVRQQVLFNESTYMNVGQNEISSLSVGLGTDIDSIRQVRDIFLDQSYREETGRMGFYDAQASAVEEIETILGETEGESFSKMLDNLWGSISELSKHPEGLATRGGFIQNSVIFVEKANLIKEQFDDYQMDMNAEIINSVKRINEIGEGIDKLNDVISQAEMAGGNANDYRDSRNLLLDELSGMVDVSYREEADGSVMVNVENVPFVIKGYYFEMDVVQAEAFSDLVVPNWPNLDKEVFNFKNPVGPSYDNDIGRLKGMILARGTRSADYTDLQDETIYENEIEKSVVMQAQAQFDNLIHGIVTMVNDLVAPNTNGTPAYLDTASAPYGLDGSQGNEIFVRKHMDRYEATSIPADQYNEEDTSNRYSLYSAGNIEVNPDVLANYNLISLSREAGADGDNTVVQSMLDAWDEPFSTLEPGTTGMMSFREYYTGFVGSIGAIGNVATLQMENQELMSLQIDNQRSMLTGVSSDEELGNMMKYQHAYNAAARVVTTIDSMIEQVVTSLGLVGR